MKSGVSVIIPTRDRATILDQCLQHLYAQEGGPPEVIVVDNSLDHDSVRRVVSYFPFVVYIKANPNTCNPSLMRNVGMRASQGNILAFIDDDTLVAPGWLEAVTKAFADPNVGGVTGRVIESGVAEVASSEIGRFSPRGEITMNFNSIIANSVPVEFMYGCNMAVRRSVLHQIGQYDPWYGIMYEEQDLSFRIRKKGFLTLYVPNIACRHLKAPRPSAVVHRSENFDVRSMYMSCRSLSYLCVSHFGVRLDFMKVALLELPRNAMQSLLKRPPSISGLLRIPATLIGGLAGYLMAAASRLGLHSPPPFEKTDAKEGTLL